MTNLTTRIGDYADTGKPLFALVDSHSFYVIGYFEETKLRHIREGAPAQITLYSDNKTLRGHVSSIGRAIYDQSVESDSSLIPDVKPNVPWVRLAQRVPVRFALDKVPGDVTLVSGTTCERIVMVIAQFALVQGHAGAMALCVTQYHCHVSGADGCLLFESG